MTVQQVYIYTLLDPDNPEFVRYVGKTVNPKNRYNQHIYISDKKATSKNSKWVKSLIKSGKNPIMEIIDCVTEDVWQHYEKYYIKLFKSCGALLNNHSLGGDLDNTGSNNFMFGKIGNLHHNYGKKFSEKTKQKMSLKAKGNKNHNKGKKIAWVDNEGNILEIYKNISDLENKTKLNRESVYQVVIGKRNSLFSFKFKYINE